MVIAEMASADVPVKVLGLHIQRKDVGQQRAQDGGNLRNGVAAQVRRGCRGCFHRFRQGRCSTFGHDYVSSFGVEFRRSRVVTVSILAAVPASYRWRPSLADSGGPLELVF